MTVWLWFFGNTLCHTRKQSHHRLSQHRLRNIDLIRGCSPTIYPTVSFGQLELYIFPPPRFWSWNIIPIRVTTLHNIIHCFAYQWESKWAARIFTWLNQCLAIRKRRFRIIFCHQLMWYYLLSISPPKTHSTTDHPIQEPSCSICTSTMKYRDK